MKDLIERLEKLDGPCRECDAEIAIATGLFVPDDSWTQTAFQTWHKDFNQKTGAWTDCFQPKEHTESIDAALTPIPDGWEWNDGHISRIGGDYHGQTHVVRELARGYIHSGFHKQPAIAICIAALKARQSLLIEGER